MTGELERGLGRVEGKLDLLLIAMNKHIADDDRHFEELGGEISRLKMRSARSSGYGAAVGTGVTLGVSLMVAWLRGL